MAPTAFMDPEHQPTEDEIAGERFPRGFDQTHALNLDLDYRLGDHWTLNLAWRYHTGWSTTPTYPRLRTLCAK